jgi:hypothetical protein
MSVFGVGASSCGAKFEELAFSRMTEVAVTSVPAGTSTGAAEPQAGSCLVRLPSAHPTRKKCRRSRCNAG